MTARVAGQRFRQRKLSVKQNLAIIREEDIVDNLDDEAQRNMPKIETGVDKGEEIEHHLQAIISASAAGVKVDSVYIPTPPTNVSTLQYERLYQPKFQEPRTYIRSSSTVEDCIGCPYDMNSDDDVFLKQMNTKRPKNKQCSEDQFEEVMNFFEQTAFTKQPFAHLDNTPVLTFEDVEASYDETIDESSRVFAKDIYEHWKARREEHNNSALMPSLKLERSETKDSEDPFVCFRRREFRQARKTRGRDAQVTEKLKKLRSELELARQLMHTVKQREHLRRDQIAQDRAVFEKRAAVKDSKRTLSIKDDDEDLITQKPQAKPKPKLDASIIQRGMPGMIPKAPLTGGDSRPPDAALAQLSEERARKQAEIDLMVQDNIKKHKQWNTDWVDNTWRPITPPLDNAQQSSFRTAVTEFLPTPPASITSEEMDTADNASMISRKPSTADDPKRRSMIRYASPPSELAAPRPSYRKRVGRGGRIFVDRRGLKRSHSEANEEIDDRVRERLDYDQDSDDDTPMYYNDPYGEWNLKYRIAFLNQMQRDPALQQKMLEDAARRQQQAASVNAAVNGSAAAGARAALSSAAASSMRPPA